MKPVRMLLFPICVMMLLVTGCWQPEPPAPERDFTLEELLLDLSVFPEGWEVSSPPGPTPSGDGAIFADESIAIWFRFRPDPSTLLAACHEVYRFRWANRAAREFRKQQPILFNSQSIALLTPWEVPDELPYRSLFAEQSHFACAKSGITNKWGCRFMGQYEEYLVIFSTTMGERMSYRDLELILQTIDKRMAKYLGESVK